MQFLSQFQLVVVAAGAVVAVAKVAVAAKLVVVAKLVVAAKLVAAVVQVGRLGTVCWFRLPLLLVAVVRFRTVRTVCQSFVGLELSVVAQSLAVAEVVVKLKVFGACDRSRLGPNH